MHHFNKYLSYNKYLFSIKRFYHFGYSKPNPLPFNKLIADFRSDTVTRISKPMKNIMFNTEDYGDDVYDEDFIVKELEDKVAKLCGKERALFCVSGTMTNQLALRAQLAPLQSLICDSRSHIYEYEAGGISYHTQAQTRPITPSLKNGYKTISPSEVKSSIIVNDIHRAVTAGVALENTLWGSTISLEHIWSIHDICKENNLFLHLDGARLPNACVKENISLKEYVKPFDSISICLSKSLGCPIGSVVVGSDKLIQRAKHFRKLFGGGWRQAGILASAAIYALDNHWDRLKEDHDNAEYLTNEFIKLGFTLEYPTETNQIWLNSNNLGITFDKLSKECRKEGILIPDGEYSCRLVTHLQTPKETCDKLLTIIKKNIN